MLEQEGQERQDPEPQSLPLDVISPLAAPRVRVLLALRLLSERLERAPRVSDYRDYRLKESPDLPSLTELARLFTSWPEALTAAGVAERPELTLLDLSAAALSVEETATERFVTVSELLAWLQEQPPERRVRIQVGRDRGALTFARRTREESQEILRSFDRLLESLDHRPHSELWSGIARTALGEVEDDKAEEVDHGEAH